MSNQRKAYHVKTSDNGKVAIYFDAENAEEISAFWNQDSQHQKWYENRIEFILQGLIDPDIFGREGHSKLTENVWAIKHKGRDNWRIYCQRIKHPDGKDQIIIIQCEVLPKKKSQKNDSKIKAIVERVSSNTYKLIE